MFHLEDTEAATLKCDVWQLPKSILGKKIISRTGLPSLPDIMIPKKQSSQTSRVFMLFTPWCDQGLGIQSRAYTHWLELLGHKVVIFACVPSKTSKSTTVGPLMQADPNEWQRPDETVHRSKFNRESVPFNDVLVFAQEHNVTDAFMLETCHKNIFVISAALAKAGIRIYAIPNIEMVMRKEVVFYQELKFHKILCSNQYTYDVLKYFKVPPQQLQSFPFAIPDIPVEYLASLHSPKTPVRFLLVGGMNAVRRKQADNVIQAFSMAFPKQTQLATLTVLCQGNDIPKNTSKNPNIFIIVQHLTYTEILQQYSMHHVVVMCSRAEGIGLAFHEALRSRCAVLTMETALFKEVVSPNVNGWLIKAKTEPGTIGAAMIGNDDPIVHTYIFDVKLLSVAFTTIVSMGNIAEMQAGARRSYEILYEPARVCTTLANALS